MTPAIVVAAHARRHALARLLGSLDRAVFDHPVELVISIDRSETTAVVDYAHRFRWRHGAKTVLLADEHLGLRKHILRCGDLTREHGSIVLLEDDLFVSPYFYRYASAALKHYAAEPRIAGIALYSQQYNELSDMTFTPLDDGADVFFMQLACSWGQAWSAEQWRRFRSWYSDHADDDVAGPPQLPPNVVNWPASSWKKHFIRYLIAEDLYFVYPRSSYTTNFHDPGVHHRHRSHRLQTPLLAGERTTEFRPLADATAVYDAYFEILPDRLRRIAPHLTRFDFIVDLAGWKQELSERANLVLTSRPCREPLMAFGRELKPVELNVAYRVAGSALSLALPMHCGERRRSRNLEEIAYYYGIPLHYLARAGGASASAAWKKIEAIENSTSWRITQPMRAASDWVKRLRRRAR